MKQLLAVIVFIVVAPLSLAAPAADDFYLAERYRAKGLFAVALVAYESAAEKGHPIANHWAGVFHFEGMGTEENEERAINYFVQAAERGVAGSAVYLANIFLDPKSPNRDCSRAREYVETFSNGTAPEAWRERLERCSNGI